MDEWFGARPTGVSAPSAERWASAYRAPFGKPALKKRRALVAGRAPFGRGPRAASPVTRSFSSRRSLPRAAPVHDFSSLSRAPGRWHAFRRRQHTMHALRAGAPRLLPEIAPPLTGRERCWSPAPVDASDLSRVADYADPFCRQCLGGTVRRLSRLIKLSDGGQSELERWVESNGGSLTFASDSRTRLRFLRTTAICANLA